MKKALVFILSLSLVMFFTVSVAAEEVTITVAGGAVGQELEMTEKAAEMYMEENPDVVIEVLDTPDLAQDRLGLYLQFFEAQSSEVDVFQIDVICLATYQNIS